jgi:hypothetical protein
LTDFAGAFAAGFGAGFTGADFAGGFAAEDALALTDALAAFGAALAAGFFFVFEGEDLVAIFSSKPFLSGGRKCRPTRESIESARSDSGPLRLRDRSGRRSPPPQDMI